MLKFRRRTSIRGFQGKYRFLSNFWPCVVHFEGKAYPSAEHAYQAAKTLNEKERDWIRKSRKPWVAKKRGRRIKCRRNWWWIRRRVMLDVVRSKFKNENLAKLLLATGSTALVEDNTWGDTYWGVCDGKGKNNLGKILMRVRHEMRQVDRFSKVWMLWT